MSSNSPLYILRALVGACPGWRMLSHSRDDCRAKMGHECGATVELFRGPKTGAGPRVWVCVAGMPGHRQRRARPRPESAVAHALHDLAGAGLPMRAMRAEAWAMARRGGLWPRTTPRPTCCGC